MARLRNLVHRLIKRNRTGKPNDPKCLEFCVYLLRLLFFWPKWKHLNQRLERFMYTITLVFCINHFVFVLIAGYAVAFRYKYWKSLDEATEDILMFVTGIIVGVKILILMKRQPQLISLIAEINVKMNRGSLYYNEDYEVFKECCHHERSMTQVHLFFGYGITILYTTSSVMKLLRRVEFDTLPLKYPFQPEGYLYAVTYTHQMVVMVLNSHVGTIFDALFSAYAYYICGHFKILKNKLCREGCVMVGHLVAYHNEIIRMVEKLQTLFGTYFLFIFGMNTSLICMGLIQVTQVAFERGKQIYYLKCCLYVVIKLTQMFMYCWYGQEIIEKSREVSDGAYFASWHEHDRDKRAVGNITVVLLRSQRPLMIRGQKYVSVSLNTLTVVIYRAYNFFTLFRTMT